jgi:hypothetical protein
VDWPRWANCMASSVTWPFAEGLLYSDLLMIRCSSHLYQ